MKRKIWSIIASVILGVLLLSVYFAFESNQHSLTTVTSSTSQTLCASPANATIAISQLLCGSHFTFNETSALNFYQELSVPSSGLLETFPGSQTIYIADDQTLDYFALNDIFNSTGNPVADSVAQGINDSISAWGGFYKYWNPVFVVVGDYPENWVWSNGIDQQISNESLDGKSYSVRATVFSPNANFSYYNYADQEFYYSLWSLLEGNFTAAENAFSAANSFWNDYGFVEAFNYFNSEYTSYKLALDLIVWNALESNSNTAIFANGFVSEIKNATSIMSQLQGPDGGVFTNYVVRNGTVIEGPSISQENGETTSLFTLACC